MIIGSYEATSDFVIKFSHLMANFRVLVSGGEEEHRRNLVTYTRRSIKASDVPEWGRSVENLSKMKVLSRGSIEDCHGMLQVPLLKILRSVSISHGLVGLEVQFNLYILFRTEFPLHFGHQGVKFNHGNFFLFVKAPIVSLIT